MITIRQLELMIALADRVRMRGVDFTERCNLPVGSYSVLHRLEDREYIKSSYEKDGRYYCLTRKGVAFLKGIKISLKPLFHINL